VVLVGDVTTSRCEPFAGLIAGDTIRAVSSRSGGVRMKRRIAIGVAALLSASAIIAVTAGLGGAPASAQSVGRCARVGLIGGSLTVGSNKQTAQELMERGIVNFRIDGRVSRQIVHNSRKGTGGIGALQAMRRSGYDPDCVVLALGTNDIPYKNDPKVFRRWIATMMDAVGPAARVLWINVYRGGYRNSDRGFNTILDDMRAVYPNLQTADWEGFIVAHPQLLTKDKVHLNSAGNRMRGRWVAEEVHQKLNGGGPYDPIPFSPCTISTVPLQYRAKGADVTCLLKRMRYLRYWVRPVSSLYTSWVRSKVREWQGLHGLPTTGVVDDVTRARLGLAPA
jgi:lysophospholipase L1-like esterase